MEKENQRWSPWKAAIATGVIVLVLGMIIGIVVMSVNGVLDNDPYKRGQAMGVPLAVLSGLAGLIAYKVQSKRNPDAL